MSALQHIAEQHGLIPIGHNKRPVHGYGMHQQRWRGGELVDKAAYYAAVPADLGLMCLDADYYRKWDQKKAHWADEQTPIESGAMFERVLALFEAADLPQLILPGTNKGWHLWTVAPSAGTTQVQGANWCHAPYETCLTVDTRHDRGYIKLLDPEAILDLSESAGGASDKTLGMCLALQARDTGPEAAYESLCRIDPDCAWFYWWWLERLQRSRKPVPLPDELTLEPSRLSVRRPLASLDPLTAHHPPDAARVRNPVAVALLWERALEGSVRILAAQNDPMVFDSHTNIWVSGPEAERELRRKHERFVLQGINEEMLYFPDRSGGWSPPRLLEYCMEDVNRRAQTSALSARRSVTITEGLFDAQDHLIGLPGGKLWDASQPGVAIRDLTKADLVSKRLGVTPEPGPIDAWEQLLRLQLSDEEYDWIKAWILYAVLGDRTVHSLFVIVGRGGTGKTTLASALHHMLGPQESAGYCAGINPRNLTEKRQDSATVWLARLQGSRLAIAEEPERRGAWATGPLKQLTGGGLVTARHHHKGDREFESKVAVLIVTNHMPQIDAMDAGLIRRLRVQRWDKRPEAEDGQLAEDDTLAKRLRAQAGHFLHHCALTADLTLMQEGREPENMQIYRDTIIETAKPASDIDLMMSCVPGLEVAQDEERLNPRKARAFGRISTGRLFTMLSMATDPDGQSLAEDDFNARAMGHMLKAANFCKATKWREDGVPVNGWLGIREVPSGARSSEGSSQVDPLF